MEQASSVDRLSTELIISMLEWLPRPSTALVNCSLCCRDWNRITQRLLYRHVVLDTTSISRFLARCPTSFDHRIHSLTLLIRDLPMSPEEDLRCIVVIGSKAARKFWEDLQALSSRLSGMSCLRSASLYRPSIRTALPGFYIPGKSLLDFVRSLPPSCQSLELSVRALHPDRECHCQALKFVMHQMRFIRIDLPRLCRDFIPIHLPNGRKHKLEHLIINLAQLYPGVTDTKYRDARTSDTKALERGLIPLLQRLTEFSGSESLKTLRVISGLKSDRSDPASYAALVRHDILANNSQSLPFRVMRPHDDETWMLRTKERDFVCLREDLIPMAEEFEWVSAVGGTRLPSEMMQHSSLVPLATPPTREQYCRQSNNTFKLWRDESITNRRLLEVAEGHSREQVKVFEALPDDWCRSEDGTVFPINWEAR